MRRESAASAVSHRQPSPALSHTATPAAKLCSGPSRTRLCAACISALARERATLERQTSQLASCPAPAPGGTSAAAAALLDASLKRSVDALEPLVKAKLNCAGVVRPLAPLLNASSAADPQGVCRAAGERGRWFGWRVVLLVSAARRLARPRQGLSASPAGGSCQCLQP